YCGLGPKAARALAGCPNLSELWRLDLGGNLIDDAGVAALAASPYLGRLGELGLSSISLRTRGVTALPRSRGLAGPYSLDLWKATAEDKAYREFLAPRCRFAFTRLTLDSSLSKPTREALRERFGYALG